MLANKVHKTIVKQEKKWNEAYFVSTIEITTKVKTRKKEEPKPNLKHTNFKKQRIYSLYYISMDENHIGIWNFALKNNKIK